MCVKSCMSTLGQLCTTFSCSHTIALKQSFKYQLFIPRGCFTALISSMFNKTFSDPKRELESDHSTGSCVSNEPSSSPTLHQNLMISPSHFNLLTFHLAADFWLTPVYFRVTQFPIESISSIYQARKLDNWWRRCRMSKLRAPRELKPEGQSSQPPYFSICLREQGNMEIRQALLLYYV